MSHNGLHCRYIVIIVTCMACRCQHLFRPLYVNIKLRWAQFPFFGLIVMRNMGGGCVAVILATKDTSVRMGDLETKLAENAAGFLAKQMES